MKNKGSRRTSNKWRKAFGPAKGHRLFHSLIERAFGPASLLEPVVRWPDTAILYEKGMITRWTKKRAEDFAFQAINAHRPKRGARTNFEAMYAQGVFQLAFYERNMKRAVMEEMNDEELGNMFECWLKKGTHLQAIALRAELEGMATMAILKETIERRASSQQQAENAMNALTLQGNPHALTNEELELFKLLQGTPPKEWETVVKDHLTKNPHVQLSYMGVTRESPKKVVERLHRKANTKGQITRALKEHEATERNIARRREYYMKSLKFTKNECAKLEDLKRCHRLRERHEQTLAAAMAMVDTIARDATRRTHFKRDALLEMTTDDLASLLAGKKPSSKRKAQHLVIITKGVAKECLANETRRLLKELA